MATLTLSQELNSIYSVISQLNKDVEALSNLTQISVNRDKLESATEARDSALADLEQLKQQLKDQGIDSIRLDSFKPYSLSRVGYVALLKEIYLSQFDYLNSAKSFYHFVMDMYVNDWEYEGFFYSLDDNYDYWEKVAMSEI